MADLAAVAGTERLAEITQELEGDPAALRAAATALRDAATAATDTAAVVSGRAAALDAAWEGRSADAVLTHAARLRAGHEAAAPAAEQAAAALDRAAHALEVARDAVTDVAERLVADVGAIRVSDAPSHDAARTALVEAATAEAQGHLDTCVDALAAATGELTTAGGASPLSTLTPLELHPGRPVPGDWVRAVPAPAPTATQAFVHPDTVTGAGSTGSTAGGPSAGGGLSGIGAGSSGSGWPGGGGHGDYSGGGGSSGGGGYDTGGGPSHDTGGGPPGGSSGPAAPAQVQSWIDEAVRILREQGVPVELMSREDIWTIISHESGGDPAAVNDWDSNAAAGTPSKGLMQTIGPTFESYKLPGHDDIWDPVDNILAGVRYAIERYGSVSAVPGVTGVAQGSGYVGY